jgi:hypothetical protein
MGAGAVVVADAVLFFAMMLLNPIRVVRLIALPDNTTLYVTDNKSRT